MDGQGMDYDSIVKGRRRNWDSLKPEEIRQAEKEAERQKRREELKKKGTRGLNRFKARDIHREEEEARDLAQFRRAVRQGAILFAGLAIFVVATSVIRSCLHSQRMAAYMASAAQYDQVALGGGTVRDFSDPVAAFASWRSAWLEGDADKLIESYSEKHRKLLEPSGDMSALRRRYGDLLRSGRLEENRIIAENFIEPELFRVPAEPWRHGQLALFRSQPLERLDRPGEEIRYFAAFAYDANTRSWRFADQREAPFFSVQWETEEDIQPVRGGAQAVRYDESGRRIDR